MTQNARERAALAFTQARTAIGRDPRLAPAREALDGLERQLGRPMSVALVGRISSGKSTLVNGLLGGEITATGAEELTFTVSWLRHSDRPTLTVTYRDGHTEDRDLAELRRLTVRDEADRAELASIDFLTVGLPNTALKTHDLIDTPGLDSHLGEDSENTLRLMGRRGADVTASTVEHAAAADAVVLVFCRGLAAGDAELVADFARVGMSAATPLTAIGALTKVELMWPRYPDPLVEGARVAERMMNAAGARDMLYDLRPVASKVDLAAATFTDTEFTDLVALSTVDATLLDQRLARGPYFRTREYPDLPVGPAGRAAVFDRFTGYGTHLACSLIRNGARDPVTLRSALSARSGMAGLRDLLTGHFGNRGDLIKLRRTIDEVRCLPARLGEALAPRERWALDGVVAAFAELEIDEHGFDELRVIRQHYAGELSFTPTEVAELLAITGEHGTDPASRLGLPPDAGAEQIAAVVTDRRRHWAGIAADRTAYAFATRRAAQILHRSYELLSLSVPR